MNTFKDPREQGTNLEFLAKRKNYKDFNPWPSSVPVTADNTGGSLQYSGPDRIYAFHQFARENPNLDFAKLLQSDRGYYPNQEVPTEFEFSNRKFKLSPDYRSGEDWDKNDKGEWVHRSTGTGNGYLSDIYNLLLNEDFK